MVANMKRRKQIINVKKFYEDKLNEKIKKIIEIMKSENVCLNRDVIIRLVKVDDDFVELINN